jgi:hypothetical protein
MQCAGLYWKKDDERAVRIVLKDGKLFLALSQEDRLELPALSERRFQLIVSPVMLTFDDAAAGAPQRMTIQAPGQEEPDNFERVSEFQPAPSLLIEYAGFYASEEIEPVYRIVVENLRPCNEAAEVETTKLDPTLEDYFQGPNGDIHFQRDPAGKVTGFVLNSGRIQTSISRRQHRAEYQGDAGPAADLTNDKRTHQ